MFEAGRYKGKILQSDLAVTKNGAIQFVAKCQVLADPTGKELEGHFEWTAYITLVGINGQVVEAQKKALTKSLKWDGFPATLVKEDGYPQPVELVFTEEVDNNGETRTKISWINEFGGSSFRASDSRGGALAALAIALNKSANSGPKSAAPAKEDEVPF